MNIFYFIVTRQVAAALPPPRSVVIERYATVPEKPRKRIIFIFHFFFFFCYLGDIIIERWLPYGPRPERRTIVEEASAAVTYPEPRNKVIIYEGVEARVVREFKKDGVVRGDPNDYVARYGDSLLDSATLTQMARNAGVFEDLVIFFSKQLSKQNLLKIFIIVASSCAIF